MRQLNIFLLALLAWSFSCGFPGGKSSESPDSLQGIYKLEGEQDLDLLMNRIGDAHYVLLGEASHGTSEYYTWRSKITQRLIREKGFSLVVVEGDWPDAYELNRYIKGTGTATSAQDAMRDFDRWPTWMWSNREVEELAEWMRTYNNGRAANQKAGFYGFDVYSLWESMDNVIAYLQQKDPAAAAQAQQAYSCFQSFNRDEQEYAYTTLQTPNLCREQVVRVLQLVRNTMQGAGMTEEAFSAEQNALVVVNAEKYYNAMVRSNSGSWNARDQHMVETVNRLVKLHGNNAKVIVWAHNTHVGDARATDMKSSGMVNVGQLIREQHGNNDVFVVGFGSYSGSVIAASHWGGATREMRVPAAKRGSWEAILHNLDASNKLIITSELTGKLRKSMGHRAIGVVYDPANEQGNYVPTVIPQRYDAFIFIDQTQALHPLSLPLTGKILPGNYTNKVLAYF